MTKLEQKLIELGYKYQDYDEVWYKPSELTNDIYLQIMLIDKNNVVQEGNLDIQFYVTNKEHINCIIQAYNVMQNDLAVLKECEN